LDTKEFLQKQQEQKIQNDITWLMEPSSDTKWYEPHDHMVTPIPRKPSKSGLIEVWHKDNLYLGTNTIRNGKPSPNKYWFTNEKY
jgi:hypothetical protein